MSVQVENGHTALANELLEFMGSFRIPGMEMQVFFTIMRKTWGWKKKEDRIALSQVMSATKMKKQNAHRSLLRLIEHKLVIKNDDLLSINKNYTEWTTFYTDRHQKRLRPISSSKTITPVIRNDDASSSEMMNTKETTTKETIQKKEISAEVFFSSFMESENEVVCAKATEFDVRPKDIVYSARMAMEWYRGKETENHTGIWWDSSFNRWITRSIRRHELKTNADKVAEEKKPVASGEDRWIEEHVQIVEGT